jgi:hypothetical protein
MTWFTWRQFRTQTWIVAALVVAAGALLAATVHTVSAAYTGSGLAACSANCGNAVDVFMARVGQAKLLTIYDGLTGLLYVLPALVGIFWGAPLVARELEAGTHRLAWNQSVTRGRWLAVKLGVVGATAAATAAVLSWATMSWARHIDQAVGQRMLPLQFGGRGLVPIGYALFAFMAGVTLGMLIRRTVPAMAATFAVYAAAVIAVAQLVRSHLVPPTHTTVPLDMSWVTGFERNRDGLRVVTEPNVAGAWVLDERLITPSGQPFTGAGFDQYCGSDVGPNQCFTWIGSQGLREQLTLHPANHFWPLQYVESGLLLAVSLLLAGFCFFWIRRRTT